MPKNLIISEGQPLGKNNDNNNKSPSQKRKLEKLKEICTNKEPNRSLSVRSLFPKTENRNSDLAKQSDVCTTASELKIRKMKFRRVFQEDQKGGSDRKYLSSRQSIIPEPFRITNKRVTIIKSKPIPETKNASQKEGSTTLALPDDVNLNNLVDFIQDVKELTEKSYKTEPKTPYRLNGNELSQKLLIFTGNNGTASRSETAQAQLKTLSINKKEEERKHNTSLLEKDDFFSLAPRDNSVKKPSKPQVQPIEKSKNKFRLARKLLPQNSEAALNINIKKDVAMDLIDEKPKNSQEEAGEKSSEKIEADQSKGSSSPIDLDFLSLREEIHLRDNQTVAIQPTIRALYECISVNLAIPDINFLDLVLPEV